MPTVIHTVFPPLRTSPGGSHGGFGVRFSAGKQDDPYQKLNERLHNNPDEYARFLEEVEQALRAVIPRKRRSRIADVRRLAGIMPVSAKGKSANIRLEFNSQADRDAVMEPLICNRHLVPDTHARLLGLEDYHLFKLKNGLTVGVQAKVLSPAECIQRQFEKQVPPALWEDKIQGLSSGRPGKPELRILVLAGQRRSVVDTLLQNRIITPATDGKGYMFQGVPVRFEETGRIVAQ